jgi:hypothetical protein
MLLPIPEVRLDITESPAYVAERSICPVHVASVVGGILDTEADRESREEGYHDFNLLMRLIQLINVYVYVYVYMYVCMYMCVCEPKLLWIWVGITMMRGGIELRVELDEWR